MKIRRDIADFLDSYCTTIPQHRQRICIKPDFREFLRMPRRNNLGLISVFWAGDHFHLCCPDLASSWPGVKVLCT